MITASHTLDTLRLSANRYRRMAAPCRRTFCGLCSGFRYDESLRHMSVAHLGSSNTALAGERLWSPGYQSCPRSRAVYCLPERWRFGLTPAGSFICPKSAAHGDNWKSVRIVGGESCPYFGNSDGATTPCHPAVSGASAAPSTQLNVANVRR